MRLSIAFTGFDSIASALPSVDAAEEAGLDGVWVCEHLGFHDAMVPAAAYLGRTERIDVGLVGLGTAGRHPAMTATEVASLCELAPGRVRIQVGTGDPALTAKLGVSYPRPLSVVESFVHSLRDVFSGLELNAARPSGEFHGFRYQPLAPAPAIDVMAVRPRMLKLAAQLADGVSLSAGASRTYLRNSVKQIESDLAEAGRSRKDFRITAMAFGFIMPGVEAGLAQFGPMLATFPAETTAVLAAGLFDTEAFVEAAGAGRTMDAAKMLTPDVLRQITFAAEPDQIADVLAEYADTGIDELGILLLGPAEMHPATIHALAAAHTSR